MHWNLQRIGRLYTSEGMPPIKELSLMDNRAESEESKADVSATTMRIPMHIRGDKSSYSGS